MSKLFNYLQHLKIILSICIWQMQSKFSNSGIACLTLNPSQYSYHNIMNSKLLRLETVTNKKGSSFCRKNINDKSALKVSKFQKQFFLKLHCPNSDRNFLKDFCPSLLDGSYQKKWTHFVILKVLPNYIHNNMCYLF